LTVVTDSICCTNAMSLIMQVKALKYLKDSL